MNSSIFSTPPAFRYAYPVQVRFESSYNRARLVQYGSVKQNFYEVLGVPESGSLPEIKQAYKRLALKYHPDVSPPDRVDEHTVRFVRVREAYETLSDPNLRDLYDRELNTFEFPCRHRSQYDKDSMGDKSEWKSRWQLQLLGLRTRTTKSNNNL